MLPSERRLRDNRHFRRVYAQGRSHVHECAVLYVWRRQGAAASEASGNRIGFVVSKKLGKAVCRNRIKRRLREATRLLLPQLRDDVCDVILVGRKGAITASWQELNRAVKQLMRRARLLAENAPGAEAPPEEKRP